MKSACVALTGAIYAGASGGVSDSRTRSMWLSLRGGPRSFRVGSNSGREGHSFVESLGHSEDHSM
jgi:hypothetical protein